MRPSIDPGPIVIVGAGGFGRECLDIVEALNSKGAALEFVGFVDDGDVDHALLDARHAVYLGGTQDASHAWGRFVIGIGNGSIRRDLDRSLGGAGLRAVTLHHPTATIGSLVTIADGSILCAGVRVTTNVGIGRHVHLNLNTTVGHDAVIEDYVTVFPSVSISGNVRVGSAATLGTGANILPGISVGEGAFVGAGAVVNRDVEAGTTVAGVPAKPIESRT